MHPTQPKETINPAQGWPAVQTAWQEAQREAGARPWLARLLRRPGKTLLARFGEGYAWLRSLSRQRRRALMRRAGMGLAGVALLLALGSAPVHAADITVDGTDCTLIEAIISANNDAAAGNGCVDGDGADTITLQGPVTLTSAYDANYNGLPPVTTEITIAGNGHTISRDPSASDFFRILAVDPSGALTLNQVRITGGFPASDAGGGIHNSGVLTITNYSVIYNNKGGDGTGIYNSGTLTLDSSQVMNNEALYGASGIANRGTLNVNYGTISGNRYGVGVDNSGALLLANTTIGSHPEGVGIDNSGTLTVTNSYISGNLSGIRNEVLAVATVTGSALLDNETGGIDNSGTLAFTNSLITGYGRYGAAILNSATGVATVTGSTLRNNQAGYGSGIDSSGMLTVTNSTLSSNYARGYADGGVLRICGGEALVHNSTISGNLADFASGGGIFVCNNSLLTIDHSTITGNTAKQGDGGGIAVEDGGTVVVSRSLISGNTATAGLGDELFAQSSGDITLDGNNLIGHSGLTNALAMYNVTPGGSDITATGDGTNPTALSDILNTTLADNGGPTFTHALAPRSPAINAAGSVSLTTDQRGVSRPQGAASDIGAVEEIINARINNSDCDLIDAITAANINTDTGICNAGNSGADTIQLLADVDLTTTHNTDYGNTGLPSITSEITIEGDGYTIRRDDAASDNFRILYVRGSGDLTLNEITISGGRSARDGGGILNHGKLTINKSTISDNHRLAELAAAGGGIANRGILNVNSSTISGNRTSDFGAGIYNGENATATINHSTITNNAATSGGSNGGGIYQQYYGTTTLNHSLISGNSAAFGAELYQHFEGTINLDSYNLLGYSGLSTYGAIGDLTPGASDITATSDGTDPTALAAILNSTLYGNGGPTPTHALVSGSPAIDVIPAAAARKARAGLAVSCEVTDQRGVIRANGGNTGIQCDIGSFEFEQAPTAVTILDFSSAVNWWGNGPQLHWETGDESELFGFHIWRGTADKAETRLTAELIGATGSFGGSQYTWQDAASFGWGQRVYYWLEAVGADGSSFSGPVEVWGIGRIFLPSVAR